MPEDWSGRRVVLRFEAVNYSGQLWVNGRAVGGKHTNAYFPWEVDVTEALHAGKPNTMVVLVRAYDGSKRQQGPFNEGSFRYFRGIWQDVWLQTRPAVHVTRISVVPSVRRWTMRARAWIRNDGRRPQKVKLRQRAVRNGRVALELPSRSVLVQPGQTAEVEVSRPWANPVLWGIGGKYGEPELYTLVSELHADGAERASDYHTTRFGFREMWIEGFHFYLNGHRIYLRGTNGGASGDRQRNAINHRQYVTRLYQAMRSQDLNMYRFHRHTYPPLWMDVADEMGMLIMNESTLSVRPNEVSRAFLHEHYRRWLARDCNHPSIVVWSADNENLVPKQVRSETDAWVRGVAAELRVANRFFRSLFPPDRIVVHSGDVPTWTDPHYQVADMHYPEFGEAPAGNRSMDNWEGFFRKPLIYGETIYPRAIRRNGGRPAGVRKHAKRLKTALMRFERNRVPGVVGWWVGAGGVVRGVPNGAPWGPKTDNEGVDIPWPSDSGRSPRARVYKSGWFQRAAVNWFDPDRPLYMPNLVDKVWRESTPATPPLRDRRAPEAIVRITSTSKKAPVAGAVVWVRPAGGQAMIPEAIVTDAAGTAWFELSEPGRYQFSCQAGSGRAQKVVDVPWGKLDLPPGYQHIKRIEMKLEGAR